MSSIVHTTKATDSYYSTCAKTDAAKKLDAVISNLVLSGHNSAIPVQNRDILRKLAVFYPSIKNKNLMGYRLECNVNQAIYGDSNIAIGLDLYLELKSSYRDGRLTEVEVRRSLRDGVKRTIHVFTIKE